MIHSNTAALWVAAAETVITQEQIVSIEQPRELLSIEPLLPSGIRITVRGPDPETVLLRRVIHHYDGFCLVVSGVKYCAVLNAPPLIAGSTASNGDSSGIGMLPIIFVSVSLCAVATLAIIIAKRKRLSAKNETDKLGSTQSDMISPSDTSAGQFVNIMPRDASPATVPQIITAETIRAAGWGNSPKTGLSWDYRQEGTGNVSGVVSDAGSPPREQTLEAPSEEMPVIRSLEFEQLRTVDIDVDGESDSSVYTSEL